MWCLLHTNVHLHIPYTIASFLSSGLAVGAKPQGTISGVHFFSQLVGSYGVDTHGMTYYLLWELEKVALRRLCHY